MLQDNPTNLNYLRQKVLVLIQNASSIAKKRVFCFPKEKCLTMKNSIESDMKIKKFSKHFMTKSDARVPSLEDYFERITSEKNTRGFCTIIAGYLFYQILLIPRLFDGYKESYNIKLFGACLYIAQKIHLETPFATELFAKLLGVSKKKLIGREAFLCGEDVFNFDFKVDESKLEDFVELLIAL